MYPTKNVLDWLKRLKQWKFIELLAEAFLLCLIVLTILGITISNNLSEESYNYIRLARHPFSFNDGLSYGGRVRLFSLTPILLWFFSLFFGLENVVRYLPLIVALLSVILFNTVLKRNIEFKVRVVAILIFIFSSSFLRLYGNYNSFLLPILIILLCLLLFKYNWRFVFLLALIPFFDFMSTFLVLGLLLIYSLYKRDYRLLYVFPFLILIPAGFFLVYGFPEVLKLEESSFLYNVISDFGGNYGIGLFIWILSFFGFLKLWERKYQYLWVYTAIVFLILFSFYNIKGLFYLSFFASVLASYGFFKLREWKWEGKLVQRLMIYIMVIGLIFSFISSFSMNQGISDDAAETIEFLKGYGGNGTVFSHYSNGILINIAGKKNVMDSDFFYAPHVRERYNDSLNLFYSRYVDDALAIMERHNITVILINNKMREGMVWNRDEEGLLFLLKYSKRFKKVYSSKNIDIWEVNS